MHHFDGVKAILRPKTTLVLAIAFIGGLLPWSDPGFPGKTSKPPWLLGKLIILAGKLDACGIVTIGRRHSVNSVTFRTLADKGYQGKVGAASLAFGG